MMDEAHEHCRLREFMYWSRVFLEHERAYLSKIMATSAAFLSQEDQAGIVHDINDIDEVLKFHPARVKV